MNAKRLVREILSPVPSALRRHHTRGKPDVVRRSIETHYHKGWRSKENYSPESYDHDLQAHLHKRLASDRRLVVPWLNAAKPLKGARILEIGCGTGSSTVALAEQGAHVTAIDIDEDALVVARDRCEAHGVKADIRAANIHGLKLDQRYDIFAFVACLEHMTIQERLDSLSEIWGRMDKGALLVIVETPNRLWWFDQHTSRLPFFNWLPDELAFTYSKFSPKEIFRDMYREISTEQMEHFLRRGRGMSFHEVDTAIGPSKELGVVSSLSSFLGWRRSLRESSLNRRYKSFLRAAYPGVHEGWFDPNLDLIIRKA